MAKDPAFLFYPGDYLRDTQCLSEAVQVAYDRIMCEHMRHSLITKKQFDFFTKKLRVEEKEELLMVLTETNDGYQITWVVESIEKRKAFTESRRQSRLKSDEDKVRIYIVRDNVRSTYKIGSSVNPIRRYNELANQKNPAIMGDEAGERDITLIWYSDIVKRSEEKSIHNQFISKKIYGEWFNLTDYDINLITKKLNGTYVNRTENEIENEIESVIGKENKKPKPKIQIEYPFSSNQFLEVWAHWKDYKKNEHKFNYKTPQSEQASLNELAGLATDEQTAIKIIHQSMAKGWKGFFELKTNTNGKQPTGGNVSNLDIARKIAEHYSKT